MPNSIGLELPHLIQMFFSSGLPHFLQNLLNLSAVGLFIIFLIKTRATKTPIPITINWIMCYLLVLMIKLWHCKIDAIWNQKQTHIGVKTHNLFVLMISKHSMFFSIFIVFFLWRIVGYDFLTYSTLISILESCHL